MARVAFLVDEMFEDSEFRVPYERVRAAGHEAVIVGLERGKELTGVKGREKITVERAVSEVTPNDFDALVVPGGYSPDHLRPHADAVQLVRDAVVQGKPVAAVCHGPSLLIDAGVLSGRTVASWPSVKVDLLNAGAVWVDRQVVEDGNLITSRNPGDLDAFSNTLLAKLAKDRRAAA